MLLVAGVVFAADGEPVSMTAFPHIAVAPADVVVKATVATSEQNRAIEVVLDSPDYYRSSRVDLEGNRAPRTTIFELRSVPSGRYVITTRVLGAGGQVLSSARQTYRVLAPGESPSDDE
jgi:hypothetical protein